MDITVIEADACVQSQLDGMDLKYKMSVSWHTLLSVTAASQVWVASYSTLGR